MSFGFPSLIAPVAVPGDAVVASSGAEGGAGDFEAVLATVSNASEGPSDEPIDEPANEDLPLGDGDQVEDASSTTLPVVLLAPVVVLQAQPLETAPETEVVTGEASATPSLPADAPSLNIVPERDLHASALMPEVSTGATPEATAPASVPVASPEQVAPTPSPPLAPSTTPEAKVVEPAAPRDAGARNEARPFGSEPKLENAGQPRVDAPPRETSVDIATAPNERDPVETGIPSKGGDQQPSSAPQVHATPQPANPAPPVSRVDSRAAESALNAQGAEETAETGTARVDPGVTSGEETPAPPSDSPPASPPAPHKSERADQPERTLSIAHDAEGRSEEEVSAKQAPQETSVSAPVDIFERSRTAPAALAAATTPQTPLAELVDAPVDPLSPNTTVPEHANTPQERASANTSLLSRVSVETTAQIAAQIVRRLEGRSTRFEMALTPEDLGRVDVSMEVGADGALTARLAFDNPAAAAELRGRADELRRQLQDAGFQLAQDSLQFSQRDGSQSRREFDRRPDRAFSGAAKLAADADAAAPITARWTPLTLAPRGVDLKV